MSSPPTTARRTDLTHSSRLLGLFLEHFNGHFDNHAQVATEEAMGMSPREGGGHEHIHCVLTPVTITGHPGHRHLLASYYFNGQPSAVFRERLYAIDALADDEQFGSCVRMQIFKLRDEMQARLRETSTAVSEIAWSAASDLDEALHVTEADVFWRWCGERFEGQMRTESIEIVSERSGRAIAVRDDVALWADALWVNDRGTDAETGEYVYGNIHDVPYKMQRVKVDHWTSRGAPPPAE